MCVRARLKDGAGRNVESGGRKTREMSYWEMETEDGNGMGIQYLS